jgi:hypothetical protein
LEGRGRAQRTIQLSGRNWQEHPRAAQLIEPSGWVIWTSIL